MNMWRTRPPNDGFGKREIREWLHRNAPVFNLYAIQAADFHVKRAVLILYSRLIPEER